MQFDRRAIAGPALAAVTALGAVLIDGHVYDIPNPAPLLVCIVAFAGSLSGLGSAAVSAAIAIMGSALFFLDHRGAQGYDEADLIRLAMLAVAAGATAAVTGLTRTRIAGCSAPLTVTSATPSTCMIRCAITVSAAS